MADTFFHGQWTSCPLGSRGGIEVSVVGGGHPLTLEVRGVRTQALDSARTHVGFAAQNISADQPVMIVASSSSGEPFPASATVTVAVNVTQMGRNLLIKGIPVGGDVQAELVTVTRDDQGLTLRPASPVGASVGLGGWLLRHHQSNGVTYEPRIHTVLMDSSASMAVFRERAEALVRFINELRQSSDLPDVAVNQVRIAQQRDDGVGSLADAPLGNLDPGTLIITDLPLPPRAAQGATVIGLCAQEVGTVLACPGTTLLDDVAWEQLLRSDTSYDRMTASDTAALIDVLCTAQKNGDQQ